MKTFFTFVCLCLISCKDKPTQPITVLMPAPLPTLVAAKTDPCANAKSDEGCSQNSEDCIFTTDDNHCVIAKKKPTQAVLKKLALEEKERLAYLKKFEAEEKQWAAEMVLKAKKEKEHQKQLCSGKNIMNTCCTKACSGEQSIQNCLMSFYRKGCDAVDGMTITCGCAD